MSEKKSLIYSEMELDPQHEYFVHLYEVPLDDEEALREAVEAMQLNLYEMTEKAVQPQRASAQAARRKAENFAALCAVVDAPERAGWLEKDLLDAAAEQAVLSVRMQERLTRYIRARRRGAAPETAVWVSEKGNWRKFMAVLKDLPK
ncbi:hypothetical protein [Ruegeria arenilitoris]|uniref:hypothetical protein n=1 Tax=Ruegeria arenilitoris TaxID=1173585 RepID=UPI00147C122F|nr:hypothetical protein [Ruegeria arenilitoris]